MVGLVGPNGAGKTTLLNLAVGMRAPDRRARSRCSATAPRPARRSCAPVGFVAQDTPTYGGFNVEDHLRLGARLNPGWDGALAHERIARLGLDLRQKAASCPADSARSWR